MRKLIAYRINQVVSRFWRSIAQKGASVTYVLVDQILTLDKADARTFIVGTTSILVEVTSVGI
ncbi:MAG: hypothetical protein ACI9BG_000286 [Parasphingorhabdus sp.]|jgi:hypothetical protein|tara:strand:- start:2852 stop:3040 length:189 start_codon:yes stop_codon:yes gene_type:complete